MKIRLTRTVHLHSLVLKNTLELLLPSIGTMQFIEEDKPLIYYTENFRWDEFFTKCTEYRRTNSFKDNDFLVVLTELRNEKNWFSKYSDQGERTFFIYTRDWENYIYCEPYYPIAYEIIENIIQCLAFQKYGKQLENYFHKEPVVCMNDMCTWKVDITFKLRTGDICPACLKLLSDIVEEAHINQAIDILVRLRKGMLFNKKYQKPLSFEESLPFTVAITKRKVGTSTEPFRKLLMLIDHFDSIIRTAVIMIAHLSKTKEEVKIFLEESLRAKPSLGHWVNALTKLSNQTINTDWGIHLPKDFTEKIKQVIQITNSKKIVKIRNEQRAHEYINCNDDNYKETFQECLPPIEEMEKLLSPLFYRFKYYHVLSCVKVSERNFSIRVHNVSGSNPTFIEKEINTTINSIDDIPTINHFYLVTPDISKWFDLDPYLKYSFCSLCKHNRILVYDGIRFLEPYIGHRI